MAVPTLASPLRPTAPARVLADPALLLISVVIINYRRWEETAALVDQLLGQEHLQPGRVEILIIDNASPPHPLQERLQKEPRVRLHRLPQNRGFAAGVNAGFHLSGGRWLLVLNPDISVSRDFLDLACAAAREYDLQLDCRPLAGSKLAVLDHDAEDCLPVGVVGFQLRNGDGTHQPSTGCFPTLGRMLAGLFRPRARRKYQRLPTLQRQQVPWVTGSCLLIRRACLAQLAGFDEEFFLYYEDVDFCRRAQASGWTVCYEPAVQAVHLDPLHSRRLTEPLRALTRHASLTYFRKHLPGWQFRALAQLIRAEAWLRQHWATWQGRTADAIVCRQLRGICRDLLRHRPAEARQRLEELLRQVGWDA